MADRHAPVPELDWSPARSRAGRGRRGALWSCRSAASTTCPRRGRRDEEGLDGLNARIKTAIHADGRVYCSNAVLDGRFGLRACIVNFRTEAEHLELLREVAAEHGERLASSSA